MNGTAAQDRLISLDVFRGLTIAGMTLVNNPGTWSAIYGPLRHADWHGITPTDYVFPFFLFIVGVAIPIALSKRMAEGVRRDVYWKIISRAAIIFSLGLVMSAIPFFNFGKTDVPFAAKFLVLLSLVAALFFLLLRNYTVTLILGGAAAVVMLGFYFAGYTIVPYDVGGMRIPGVLQRIAVCYLIVSIIFLHTNWKQQTIIGAALLLIYWLLMTTIPASGCEVTTIDDKACNLSAWLDRAILTESHIWSGGKVYDPEGILSTIPALVTTLSGVLTGTWLMRDEGEEMRDESEPSTLIPRPSALNKAAGMFFFGTLLLALGWTWSLVFPINKPLWTSSYVLYTSGLALLTLASCYWLIDIKGYTRWAKPFVIFGVNALALYVFSGIMARILGIIRVPGADGKETPLQQWIFNNVFLPFASPINASLAFAICFILFWLFLMWLLYRRRIYVKV